MASKSKKGNQPSDKKAPIGDDRLPFEPSQNRKKPLKLPLPVAKTPASQVEPKSSQTSKGLFASMPEVVSRRMAQRMAFFCGVPTALGMLTFVVSYVIVVKHLFELPNVVVVLVSMGFFGLGVLGLSYGVFSASWDEAEPGSLLGIYEFGINVKRTIASWQQARQKSS
jgi:hypothetical protein